MTSHADIDESSEHHEVTDYITHVTEKQVILIGCQPQEGGFT